MYRLDIAEVAQRSGLNPSTLRYYEKRGLIMSDGRRGLRREYDDSVLTRLALIALGRKAGYPLIRLETCFAPKEENTNSTVMNCRTRRATCETKRKNCKLQRICGTM